MLSTNGRLELHFRPDDPFCKPSVSTEKTCGNLLVKVRREAESSDGLQYQLEVLGVVEMLYLFDKPCDFQYLPVARTTSGAQRDLLSDIVSSMEVSRSEYLSRDVQPYLPPVMFSRREKPYTYSLEFGLASEHLPSPLLYLDLVWDPWSGYQPACVRQQHSSPFHPRHSVETVREITKNMRTLKN